MKAFGLRIRTVATILKGANSINWDEYRLCSGFAKSGNIVVARVKRLGVRNHVDVMKGRELTKIKLRVGDYIIGIIANRRSSTSEYGIVGNRGIPCKRGDTIHLLAAGGICGICSDVSPTLKGNPLELSVEGLLVSISGKLCNLHDFCISSEYEFHKSCPIILVCGTSAEVGKTTAVGNIIEALGKLNSSLKIIGVKMTGTGRLRDTRYMAHKGAMKVFDFTDVGLPTTYVVKNEFQSAMYALMNTINKVISPDIIIGECGGDIIEANVPTLLTNKKIMKYTQGIIHCSLDVLGIVGSLQIYKKFGVLNKIKFITYPLNKNHLGTQARLRNLGISIPLYDPLDKAQNTQIAKELYNMIK